MLARNARFKERHTRQISLHFKSFPRICEMWTTQCASFVAIQLVRQRHSLEFPVEFSFEEISGVALIVAIPTCICMWIILVSPEMQSFVQNCVILSSKIFSSSTSGKQRCPTVHQSYRCLKINRRWSLMKMTGEKRCTAEKIITDVFMICLY